MSSRPHIPLPALTGDPAADELAILANRAQNDYGWDFQRAWNHVCNQRRDLVEHGARRHQEAMNRQSARYVPERVRRQHEGSGIVANRTFAPGTDGWVQVVPKGEFPHPTGITQVVDEAAIRAIVTAFNRDAGRPNFPGLLVDFEHFSYDTNQPSAAAGWITALEGRPDGVWARVEWSQEGEAALRNGSYRLLSPVFSPAELEHLDAVRKRPVRLDSVGLTNAPNMKGMAPLSNRADGLEVPARDWSAAEAREDAVFERLLQDEERRQATDRGFIDYSDEDAARRAFLYSFRVWGRKLGDKAAWDNLKQNEPHFWTRFVLNYPLA
jgi:hypothetical protein